MSILPDVLEQNLKVVFCGTAAGNRSAELRQYYAGPGNKFWPVLARVKLTPRQLQPVEFHDLLQYGIGLTDLAKAIHGPDSQVSSSKLDLEGFRSKIARFRPRAVAFNGKKAAVAFFGRDVDYGRQEERIEGSYVFVLPSTSGAAQGFWNESYWQQLADFVKKDED